MTNPHIAKLIEALEIAQWGIGVGIEGENEACSDCRAEKDRQTHRTDCKIANALASLRSLPESGRPKAIGVWCQPIEGLLYDLDLLPEQISKLSKEWRLMKVLEEMHAHFEASEAYIDKLEGKP